MEEKTFHLVPCVRRLPWIAMRIVQTSRATIIRISMGMGVMTGAHVSLARVPAVRVSSTGIWCARAIISATVDPIRRIWKYGHNKTIKCGVNGWPDNLPDGDDSLDNCWRKFRWSISRYSMLLRIHETYLQMLGVEMLLSQVYFFVMVYDINLQRTQRTLKQ